VPVPGPLSQADQDILAVIDHGFHSVGELFEGVHLRAALFEALRLASEVNKYLDFAAPWFSIKTDKDAAGTTIYTALRAIDSLKVLFAPFLPFSSERLHTYLGYSAPLFGSQEVKTVTDSLGEHQVLRYLPGDASGKWEPSQLEPGKKLVQPAPLYRKLDESLVEEERSKLGKLS
jgi:methionyl-tRNA synthetase